MLGIIKKLAQNKSDISWMLAGSKERKMLLSSPVQGDNLSKGLLINTLEENGASFNLLLRDAVMNNNNEAYLTIKETHNENIHIIWWCSVSLPVTFYLKISGHFHNGVNYCGTNRLHLSQTWKFTCTKHTYIYIHTFYLFSRLKYVILTCLRVAMLI